MNADSGPVTAAVPPGSGNDAGHRAYCCEACDDPDPHWVIERWGDAVVTWACDTDLAGVCEVLQRDHEVTHLSVRDARKAQAAHAAAIARGAR